MSIPVTNFINHLRTTFNQGQDQPVNDLAHDQVADTTIPNFLARLSSGERESLVNWLRDNRWGTYDSAAPYQRLERPAPQ